LLCLRKLRLSTALDFGCRRARTRSQNASPASSRYPQGKCFPVIGEPVAHQPLDPMQTDWSTARLLAAEWRRSRIGQSKS
jgi:hypothetical protein